MRTVGRRGGVGSRCVLVGMVPNGNLARVQTHWLEMCDFRCFLCNGSAVWHVLRRMLAQRLPWYPPVDPVDTAGAAETSPNFACNSPQGVPGRGLKSAEYQRSGFNV